MCGGFQSAESDFQSAYHILHRSTRGDTCPQTPCAHTKRPELLSPDCSICTNMPLHTRTHFFFFLKKKTLFECNRPECSASDQGWSHPAQAGDGALARARPALRRRPPQGPSHR